MCEYFNYSRDKVRRTGDVNPVVYYSHEVAQRSKGAKHHHSNLELGAKERPKRERRRRENARRRE
jgi:hypothetical protein